MLAGCAALVGSPSPTGVVSLPGDAFEIALDNRSSSAVKLVLWQGTTGPSLNVGPCEASSIEYAIEGPFSLRAGRADVEDTALPVLADSDELPAGPGMRLIVRVAPDGSLSFEELVGPAPMRPPGQC